jgi:hypothetical protein
MTSRERLLTALRGGTPDRVPVTMYEFSPYGEDWANHEPSYAPLLELERRYGDSFVFAPLDCPVLQGDPNAVHGAEEKSPDGTVVTTREIDTPKGRLCGVTRRDPGLMTNWQIEPLIKDDDDIERVLSMPDPSPEADLRRLREWERRVGEAGVLTFSVGDALGNVVGLFDFEDFVLRCHTDDGPIRALLGKAQAQLLRAVEAIGSVVCDAVFRLWGPEYCGAPLMDPRRFFPRYVVEPDRRAAEAIHATGNIALMHAHGRLNDLLDMIAETGVDALEPIETRPMATADVTLAEVKERIGDRVALFGAIQALMLETASPEQMREDVRRAIAVGAPGGGFGLLPTSAPFMVPLAPRVLANAEAMYEAAHAFGRYT